jgi:type IV pilus assembly protein PilV
MQASAKKGSFDAMQRSMASSLAQDIIERMRGNNAAVGSGILNGYNGTTYGSGSLSAPATRCNSTATLCTPVQLRANDLFEWEQSLMGADVKNGTYDVGGLVGVVGCISHLNNNVQVVISWEGRVETSDGASDNGNGVFGTSCGSQTDNKKRRQIFVNAFIN